MTDQYRPGTIEATCATIIREARAEFYPIAESHFVRDLLPMIAGEEGVGQDMTFWVKRVGYYTPVFIFKDGDVTLNAQQIPSLRPGAEPLFKLPPLMHNLGRKFKDSESDRDSVYEDMLTIENRVRNNPRAAAEVVPTLAKRVNDNSGETVLHYAAQVNAVLKHYGKPILSERLAEPEPASKTAPETNYYAGDEMGVELDD